jgi:hypothetical protein
MSIIIFSLILIFHDDAIHICLFEGKPTDYKYGSSTDCLMNNPTNTGRANYSNKKLTVGIEN